MAGHNAKDPFKDDVINDKNDRNENVKILAVSSSLLLL